MVSTHNLTDRVKLTYPTDNASWDPTKFTVQDAAYAAAKNPFNIETWNGNLSTFQSSGGKLRK
jgi:hypothetical protein